MEAEEFDFLIIGGGITGAATARDATSRNLKVALVEKRDFAWGTSSRSSKLIHGGLRYLQNFEMKLVFEALAERAHLLKTASSLVRPVPFYMPVYEGDPHGKGILSIGLWLYDLLSLFRSPGRHRRLSSADMLREAPFLKKEGLKGGFRYYDASMWDDMLAVETLRSAARGGAAIANYTEAIAPVMDGEKIVGFEVADRETGKKIVIRAKKVIVATGPWTDELGLKLSQNWHAWLTPSKGIHLVFDLKKIPVPGALVMSHPHDGRIAFVIPRPDYGTGVTIVGTTDGPTSTNPALATIDPTDVNYLMDLLQVYFPDLHLKKEDIVSAYVGVRPLMASGNADSPGPLQKVSREHYIGTGPGGAIVVAGGKYTTHRTMAKEIVDFAKKGLPGKIKRSRTTGPVNPKAMARFKGGEVPWALRSRYGAEALDILKLHEDHKSGNEEFQQRLRSVEGEAEGDPDGFPFLAAQLRFAIRQGMVLRLEDFYFRRVPLYLARADHGLPWAEGLSKVWAEELGKTEEEAKKEVDELKKVIEGRTEWQKGLYVIARSEATKQSSC